MSPLGRGPGRVLVALYGTFALAAGARSLYQIATQFAVSPAAYLLSLLSAVVYVVALLALVRGARTTALVAVAVELAGVLIVGTVSELHAFADQTVWTGYGSGYGFVPLLLPVLGLLWLRRART